MQKIKIFSPRKEDIDKLGSIKHNLGKKVVSKSGEPLGKTKDVLFDQKGIKGIIVGKIFSKFYIDSTFFKSAEDKIILSIDPIISLIGKEVFDSDGKKLGKVVDVLRKDHKNDLKAILIKRKFYSKKKEIPKIDISVSKKNIILKEALIVKELY